MYDPATGKPKRIPWSVVRAHQRKRNADLQFRPGLGDSGFWRDNPDFQGNGKFFVARYKKWKRGSKVDARERELNTRFNGVDAWVRATREGMEKVGDM